MACFEKNYFAQLQIEQHHANCNAFQKINFCKKLKHIFFCQDIQCISPLHKKIKKFLIAQFLEFFKAKMNRIKVKNIFMYNAKSSDGQ